MGDLKLGCLPKKFNRKTLLYSNYAGVFVPAPPHLVWREYKVPPDEWGIYGNDFAGDCTCAAVAHMQMLFTIHTGALYSPPEQEIIQAYSAVSGYDPVTKMNDNGAAITDVLDLWRKTGIADHKILAWAEIDHTDIEKVKQAIWLFGAVDIGVDLPSSAMDQFNEGVPWYLLDNDGGIEGGHSVPLCGFGDEGTNCITWGRRQGMSWDWFSKYTTECYAVITSDWINQMTQETPGGLNLTALQADLSALATA